MGDQGLMKRKAVQREDLGLPAFYAFKAGSWRSYVNLLHLPYTAWLVSYVALGWALAPSTNWERLGGVALAFFLAVGISAHALDELHGRPLKTGIPRPVLIGLALASLLGALAIGVVGLFVVSPWLLPFLVAGVFFVMAYNLELAGGRFHSVLWFSLAWGAFPVLTGYFANQGALALEALVGAAAAFALSAAQRTLSNQARSVRRKVAAVQGSITFKDGTRLPVDKGYLLKTHELALRALTIATVLLAAALLIARV